MTKKWGRPLWIFFHTIAEKIKPEEFSKNKNFMLNILKSLCSTIPCIYCEKDALLYLKTNTFTYINTKEQYIGYLRQFHNHVNKRLYKKEFSEEDIKMYKQYNLNKVLNYFNTGYVQYRGSSIQLSNNMNKRFITQEIFTFIYNNKNIFYWGKND